MAIKVGINGFGRIGRNVVRTALNDPAIEFVESYNEPDLNANHFDEPTRWRLFIDGGPRCP